jgi:hypothetical protein
MINHSAELDCLFCRLQTRLCIRLSTLYGVFEQAVAAPLYLSNVITQGTGIVG